MGLSNIFILGAALMSCDPEVMCIVQEPVALPIFQPGYLKSLDSKTHLQVGQKAPDFKLPSISGEDVSLKDLLKDNIVVLTFVPAAWTPVCSDQWPGYNVAEPFFDEANAILVGITVDNVPTLYAWTKEMGGLWFPVLSDFYPHGAVTANYGILRSNGTSERALFIIDKKGIIRYIDVHDINKRPPMEDLIRELQKVARD
jgi:peroxiredoxin (alkyl hydroperoxide reductase subunit C)